jgi:quercetin dioxygenase-like cupin family protein
VTHLVYRDLLAEAPIPERGIHSQTLSKGDDVELIAFAFAPGERLSEHTAARPAIIHVLAGEAELTVGDDSLVGGPGTWVRMDAGTRHAVVARSPMVMALYLLPRAAEATTEAR